jgi:hypothetical protein
MRICSRVESEQINIYWSEKCFGQGLLWKIKYKRHAKYTFPVSLSIWFYK